MGIHFFLFCSSMGMRSALALFVVVLRFAGCDCGARCSC